MPENDKLGRIDIENTAVILVDIQERFVPHIHEIDKVIENSVKLVKCCNLMNIPVMVTEQNPDGLGRTVGLLRVTVDPFEPYEKMSFSIFKDERITSAISDMGRQNLLIGGIEAHVCVIKSVLDGIALGYSMHWLSDAVSSRSPENVEAAYRRAVQCGAFVSTVEMAIFQLMKNADGDLFREISRIIR